MPDIAQQYADVRARTLALTNGLTIEDQVVQSMPDASPTKWHLGHTTWFFETFVWCGLLERSPLSPAPWQVLFNSYYQAVGPQFSRPHRGMLTRPSHADVLTYRGAVDSVLLPLLGDPALEALVVLGLNHEQQHQELLVTDALHLLSQNPLQPAWGLELTPTSGLPGWVAHPGGQVDIGFEGTGFHYDNEGPRHPVTLQPFEVRRGLVNNHELLAFIEDGGYQRPELWLSEGWSTVQSEGWQAPLYWEKVDGAWTSFGTRGRQPIDPDAPVAHVSLYEADAYTRWAGARLPTEAELEAVASELPDFFGARWQWTNSAYLGYPGYRPPPGAVGEYNGKFMVNQHVLRGSSVVTPPGHERISYRNFFPAHARWQFSGIRLARDV